MIGIIDYGIGNVTSVQNALHSIGVESEITADIKKLTSATGLILPGVGAAGDGMKQLHKRKLDSFIIKQVKAGKPFLGICLGMQLLMTTSEEGNVDCLNIIPGAVKKFKTKKMKVPHIGWNTVKINKQLSVMNDIQNNSYFYFVHSYYCAPNDRSVVIGQTDYEQTFCSAFQKDRIFGVQFHPEKSGEIGLQLLKNFVKQLS